MLLIIYDNYEIPCKRFIHLFVNFRWSLTMLCGKMGNTLSDTEAKKPTWKKIRTPESYRVSFLILILILFKSLRWEKYERVQSFHHWEASINDQWEDSIISIDQWETISSLRWRPPFMLGWDCNFLIILSPRLKGF